MKYFYKLIIVCVILIISKEGYSWIHGVAPIAPIIVMQTASDHGIYHDDAITNIGSPVYEVNLSQPATASDVIRIRNGDTVIDTHSPSGGEIGALIISRTLALGEGDYLLTAQQTTSNWSSILTSSISFTVPVCPADPNPHVVTSADLSEALTGCVPNATFQIVGGVDASKFFINGSVLQFAGGPYGPGDYHVNIFFFTLPGNSLTLPITVTVTG